MKGMLKYKAELTLQLKFCSCSPAIRRSVLFQFLLQFVAGSILSQFKVIICLGKPRDTLMECLLANLRWPNTVFARALADAIQRAHKDCKNKHAVDTAIILFAQFPLYLCYFS